MLSTNGVIAKSEMEVKVESREIRLNERIKKISDIPTHNVLEKIKNSFDLAEVLKNRSDISWMHDAMLLYINTITESEHLLQVSKNKKELPAIFDYVNKSLIALIQIQLEHEQLFVNFNNYEAVKRFNHALTELNLNDLLRKQIPILQSHHEHAEKFSRLRMKLREISTNLFKAKLNKETKHFNSVTSRALWQNPSLLKKLQPLQKVSIPATIELPPIKISLPKSDGDEELAQKNRLSPQVSPELPIVPLDRMDTMNKVEEKTENKAEAEEKTQVSIDVRFPEQDQVVSMMTGSFQSLLVNAMKEEKVEAEASVLSSVSSEKAEEINPPSASGLEHQEKPGQQVPGYSSQSMFKPSYAKICAILAVGYTWITGGFLSSPLPLIMAAVCGGLVGWTADTLSDSDHRHSGKPKLG